MSTARCGGDQAGSRTRTRRARRRRRSSARRPDDRRPRDLAGIRRACSTGSGGCPGVRAAPSSARPGSETSGSTPGWSGDMATDARAERERVSVAGDQRSTRSPFRPAATVRVRVLITRSPSGRPWCRSARRCRCGGPGRRRRVRRGRRRRWSSRRSRGAGRRRDTRRWRGRRCCVDEVLAVGVVHHVAVRACRPGRSRRRRRAARRRSGRSRPASTHHVGGSCAGRPAGRRRSWARRRAGCPACR